MHIDTSLLREKFVIDEKKSNDNAKLMRIIAMSNRMPLRLQAGEMAPEDLVLRSSNMHSCARFAGLLVAEYERAGPVVGRAKSIHWHDIWDKALSSFERLHNPDRWITVYHKGNIIFSEGHHHPFLDIVEKCDLINKGDYEKSIRMAESAFSQAGKDVSIDFESNVALVCAINRQEARSSMIIRSQGRTNTFNCAFKPHQEGDQIKVVHGLSISADVLEAVQLCYRIGEISEFLNMGLVQKHSDDHRMMTAAKKRLGELNIQISSIERIYHIRYRPERPNFDHIIAMTERYIRDNHSGKDSDDE